MTNDLQKSSVRSVGRPAIEPPADAAMRIEQLAAKGASVEGIANSFGVSEKVFRRWRDEYDELELAFVRGREQERTNLHDELYRQALSGNTIAGIFLLKTRHKYREADNISEAPRTNIVISIPGSRPLSDFIEGEKS